MTKILALCEKHFRLSKHNTTIRSELIAAVTNYFTLLYILSLVPEVLLGVFPTAFDANGELVADAVVLNGITAGQLLAALTVVSFWTAGIASIIMGLAINMPFIQGPSLAIATFIIYTVCKGFGYTYYQALAIIFLSGIFFFILSATGVEKKIHKAIPSNIKYAVTAGIGMFITYTGLQKAHIIAFENNSLADFDMLALHTNETRSAWLAIFGVILITILLDRHVHGAIFIGKMVCIALAVPLGLLHINNVVSFSQIPINSLVFKMDLKGLISGDDMPSRLISLSTLIIIIFSISIMDIFETMSMIIAADHLNEADDKRVDRRVPRILEIDAITTSLGSLLGMTNISTYIESTAGVVEGARTGLTAVITGLLFILTSVFAPFAGFVPSAATATTLIASGVLMMNVIKNVDFEKPANAVPAVFTMILMPLTNSL
ncbi:MAG: NCS2 family permease, partial [Firmicutes bacterium]|nr:NCS2 family permease [Bacillota bacterium]